MAVVGAPLCAVIGAQWLMLSVGGGMTSPVIVLRAFGSARRSGLGAAWALDVTFGFGAAGYLYGFAAGQLATLGILVHGVGARHPRPGRRVGAPAAGLSRVPPAGVLGPGVLRLHLGRQDRRLPGAGRGRGDLLRRHLGDRLVLGHPRLRLDLRPDRDGLLPPLPCLLRRHRDRRAAAQAAGGGGGDRGRGTPDPARRWRRAGGGQRHRHRGGAAAGAGRLASRPTRRRSSGSTPSARRPR